jgi:hypothetical protein
MSVKRGLAWLAILPIASLAADRAPYLISDFEGSTALEHWRFSGGSESSGGIALGAGHRDHGAVLSYRLEGDAYAAALWRPASPLPKRRDPAISLWIRFPPGVELFLVGKDTNGQGLRFPIAATIEHPKAGNWQYAVVPVKGRLVELGIQVRGRTRETVQGSVSFDDVQLRESSEIFRTSADAAADPPLEPAPHLGVNIHLLRDDPALDRAHAAGFEFVRMDMMWANIERGGRYRFFAYDALLRSLDARKMGVLWILDYGHPDHGGSTPRTAEDVAAFARFAGAAAAHFKGRNVKYEIWNEPNLIQFWKPSPNASEYAVLLREAVAAIRSADPSAQISSGGLSRFDEAFLSRAVDPGLAANLTALGVHPYPKGGPEFIAPDLQVLREWVARAYGERIEVWDTEWGYSSTDAPKEAPSNGHTDAGRRHQASLAVRELLTVWALRFPLAVWYDLRDDGPDAANAEQNYGLLDSSGNEKPAMKAVETLMSVLKDRTYAGMIAETPPGIHAMRFDGSADTVLIVWSDQPGSRRTVEYSKQNLISATDLMGGAIKSKDGRSGQTRVEIDDVAGPVYLCWNAKARR